MTSPTINLPATTGQKLQFRWTFATDTASVAGDEIRVEVLDTTAASTTSVFVLHGGAQWNASWRLASVDLSAFAGRQIRLRFGATDAGSNSLVEAGFDDVRVTQPQ